MKWEIIGALILAALVLSGCSSPSSSNEPPVSATAKVTETAGTTNQPAKTVQPEPEPAPNKPTTYKFNEPFTIDGLQYTFKESHTRKEIGEYLSDTFMGSQANGQYFIVKVEVKNVGKKAAYLSSSNIKIIDNKGREFETDTSAEIYLSMDPEFKAMNAKGLMFDKLNPGLSQTGYLVFDVPEDLQGTIQVVNNSIFATETAWVTPEK